MTQHERGFTLIELMVALLIFAMLAAAGVALLSFGVRAQAGATARLADVAGVRRMSVLLANDLAQATPRVARGADGQVVRAFTGNDGRSGTPVMGYVRGGRTNPNGAARASVQRVDVTLAGGQLLRQAYPVVDGSVAGQGQLLADGVTALAMRYRERNGSWRARWDSVDPRTVPVAVEMTVTRGTQAPLTFVWATGTPYP